MNKLTVFSGCAAAVLLAAGCGPELAQGDYGPEEQQWQEVISSSYSGHRPPRIAPPAIVDKASREALEKQRDQQDAASGIPAPAGDKDSEPAIKEMTPEAAVDAAAAKKDDSSVQADNAKSAPAKDADKKAEPAEKKTEKGAKADDAGKVKAASADQQDLEYEIYVVKSGDNPGSIAQKYYGKASYASLIMKANPEIKDARQIQIGTKLKIPKL